MKHPFFFPKNFQAFFYLSVYQSPMIQDNVCTVGKV